MDGAVEDLSLHFAGGERRWRPLAPGRGREHPPLCRRKNLQQRRDAAAQAAGAPFKTGPFKKIFESCL